MKKEIMRIEHVEFAPFEQKILNGIDLSVGEGEFIILIGPNGSGKSTLLKAINGTIDVSGRIVIDGNAITQKSMHEIGQKVATLTQDIRHSTFSDLTVKINLLLAFTRSSTKLSDRKCTNYLASFNKVLAERQHVLAGHLSGGQRQALALALCFAHTPRILLLDEHTSALDPKAAAWLMEVTNVHVREKNLTTIMVTHSLDHALAYGNRLIVMNEGRIVTDLKGEEKAALSKQDLVSFAY